jgi:Fe-S cluster assembly iron-binding protein IscA
MMKTSAQPLQSERTVIMLNLTATAATEIRKLADRSERPGTAGLRITTALPGTLKLSLAAAPSEDESVVDAAGARIFLDHRAAAVLNDKTLDASTDAAGRVRFTLAEYGA